MSFMVTGLNFKRLFVFNFPSHCIYCVQRSLDLSCWIWVCVRVCVCASLCVSQAGEDMSKWGQASIQPFPDLPLLRSEPGFTMSPVSHHKKKSPPALNKSHEQTSVTSGNESATQCVYYSSALQLDYLSFSAEWLENTSPLRGTGPRPPPHWTQDSPLVCIIDTTAAGCSETLKFCDIAPPPSTTTLLMPSGNLRESCYFVRNHPLFSSPVEKLRWVELVTLETAWLWRILRIAFQA